MIDHIAVPVSNYSRSKTFYEQALAPLGYKLLEAFDTADDKSAGFAAGAGPDFWIGEIKGSASHVHVAFSCPSRKSVDAFYKAALAAGGKDNGGPGLRPQYDESYYGAFVLDPDGHNIEAVCHGSE